MAMLFITLRFRSIGSMLAFAVVVGGLGIWSIYKATHQGRSTVNGNDDAWEEVTAAAETVVAAAEKRRAACLDEVAKAFARAFPDGVDKAADVPLELVGEARAVPFVMHITPSGLSMPPPASAKKGIACDPNLDEVLRHPSDHRYTNGDPSVVKRAIAAIDLALPKLPPIVGYTAYRCSKQTQCVGTLAWHGTKDAHVYGVVRLTIPMRFMGYQSDADNLATAFDAALTTNTIPAGVAAAAPAAAVKPVAAPVKKRAPAKAAAAPPGPRPRPPATGDPLHD